MKKLISEKKQVVIFAAIALIAIIAIVIALTAKPADSLPGNYVLTDASGTDNEMFKTMQKDATLIINSDNTGTLKMFGQETPVAVDQKQKKISFDGGANYAPYRLENKKLTIENGGNKVVFTKK